jgi:hypothetical protein
MAPVSLKDPATWGRAPSSCLSALQGRTGADLPSRSRSLCTDLIPTFGFLIPALLVRGNAKTRLDLAFRERHGNAKALMVHHPSRTLAR